MAFANPFQVSNFGANNPELALIPDEEIRKKIQRQALFKGLGAAGQALLNNSTKSTGQAFGAGAGAFDTGAQGGVSHGILVDQNRRAALAEAAKQKRIGELQELAPNKIAAELGILTGNSSLTSKAFDTPKVDSLIGDVNPANFTSESVQAFSQSKDYSDLRLKPNLKGGAASAAMQNLFEKQAATFLGARITPDGHIAGLDKDQSSVQRALATKAGKYFKSGKYNEAEAMSKAINEFEKDGKFPYKIKNIGDKRTVNFSDLK